MNPNPATSPDPTLAAAVLATASDAIIATDRAGVITFWNPGAARIFGFTAAEALGQSLDLIIPENLRQRHWDAFHETMRTSESRYGGGDLLAVPGLVKGGGRISLEFTIVMLKDDAGRPTGTVAILRDATKRFEELRALRAKVVELEKAK